MNLPSSESTLLDFVPEQISHSPQEYCEPAVSPRPTAPILGNHREKMGKMKITFVLPPLNMSGGIRVAAIYADKLRERGHQVTVISGIFPRPSLRKRLSALLRGRWLPHHKNEPSHFDVLSLKPRIMNRPGPTTADDVPEGDAVIATWWQTVQDVHDLPACKGAKIHFMQDYEIWGGPPEQVKGVHRLPMSRIVLTRWMADLMRQEFGQEPLATIPNSVDWTVFQGPPRGKQAVPTVGMVYAEKPYKGTDICIRAIELARQTLPNLRVLSMGNRAPTPELPLPTGANFTLQARDEKLREIYSSCDAWLFGTRVEGFGLPILEAMACRTPVIGTPAGAAPELLSQGGGILVPMADADAMAEAIVRICRSSTEEWRSLSERALATVKGYSWEDATDRFEAAVRLAIAVRS